jgi:hypothetical protein
MGPRQVALPGNRGATVPAVSGLGSGEPGATGRPPLVIAEGMTSDVMIHAGAVDTARLGAVTPPAHRKLARTPSPRPPTDAPTAPPPDVVVITVSPSTGADGRAYSSRGPLFDGEAGGRVVVERSTTPFLDGARRLIELGHDGKAVLVMKHFGSDAVTLRAKLAAAAGLTIDEHGTPRFKRWKPWGGDAPHASNDIARPEGRQPAPLRLRRAGARAEIDAIVREANSGWLRAPLGAGRSGAARPIDQLDQMLDQAEHREVSDG